MHRSRRARRGWWRLRLKLVLAFGFFSEAERCEGRRVKEGLRSMVQLLTTFVRVQISVNYCCNLGVGADLEELNLDIISPIMLFCTENSWRTLSLAWSNEVCIH